ncbi:hypothetical protein LOC54_10520 [Acetobacter sp. AN02]|uniref:hypothetical protein n=1 Tax=Acetobacter sp. AN02 TaxID=2894186 RepID=UPI0024341150|nr:hypothetical protein [Acetobacter sp. AN02]MDG6095527.1 hypothetical protein [Acetobacter sp. AN02]
MNLAGIAQAASYAAARAERNVTRAITDVGSALSLNTTDLLSDISKAFSSFQTFLKNDFTKVPVEINVTRGHIS